MPAEITNNNTVTFNMVMALLNRELSLTPRNKITVPAQTITIERAPLTLPASAEYDCAQYDLEDLVPALTGEPTGVSDG